MNLSAPFIRRPVMTTLVTASILIFGAMAFRLLPVSNLPNIDFPTITVTASLPGASPETMASAVATPLERQFSTIAGLESMTSTSGQGVTQITLQFSLDRDIDAAAQDVQAAIAKTLPLLPRDMPAPPSYQKVNPADQPVLYIALTSSSLPMSTLHEYGETLLAQRISMVSGVAQVLVYGAQKYAVRIQLDPNALAARGLGIDEVVSAVRQANVNLPTGVLHGPFHTFTLQASGQLTSADLYRPVVVAYRNGAPVRLNELGRVLDSVENDKTAAWFYTKDSAERSIILAVQRQPGTNTVEVVRRVRALLPTFRHQLPASVSMQVLYDRSVPIQESVRDVEFTLVLTLFLVVFVIFLFLRNLRATVIPSLAIPTSIVGTFAVMHLLGYSLDNLSLMALTLSIGFVVDDAIVMLENIVRHMEQGKGVWEAALKGAEEIGFTIVSMTLSLAAVFIPVLFMGGIVGRLFREFAVTIGVAILLSGFVSLSLTPMLCSLFLRPPSSHGRLYRASERVFEASRDWYGRSLRWVLRHRQAAMVFLLVTLIATVYLFWVIPKGFLPTEDAGQIVVFTEAPEGTSFESMVQRQRAATEIVRSNPHVRAFMSSVGARGSLTGPNQGILFVSLKPRHERPDIETVAAELRRQLAHIPGMRVYVQVPPPIRIGGRLSKSLYQFTLQSSDPDELYRYAPRLVERIQKLPGFLDVTTDMQIANPQVYVEIDRDRAARLGVTPFQIEDALYTAYGPRQVSTIYAPNNQYSVLMELLPEFQNDPSQLNLLYIRSNQGTLVPLSAVARIRTDVGPLTVNHTGQLPAVTVSFNLAPGYSLGDAVTAVERVAREVLPPTVATSFQGTAQAFQASQAGLGLLLLTTVLVIYVVLGILYENFIHPITILTALPFAGVGALVTLMLFQKDLSIYAFVGIIMLVGLVKKNGIIMVDFAIEARRAGKSPEDAIVEACWIRFRPIMMTTMAALMGTLPIALGIGAGAEARQPLGLAVVGGLLFSQTLTLYITPVFYVYMEAFQEWLGRRVRLARPVLEAPGAVALGPLANGQPEAPSQEASERSHDTIPGR
jgi:HAE1 family hydrophobic/amphiphilic exporter-1